MWSDTGVGELISRIFDRCFSFSSMTCWFDEILNDIIGLRWWLMRRKLPNFLKFICIWLESCSQDISVCWIPLFQPVTASLSLSMSGMSLSVACKLSTRKHHTPSACALIVEKVKITYNFSANLLSVELIRARSVSITTKTLSWNQISWENHQIEI